MPNAALKFTRELMPRNKSNRVCAPRDGHAPRAGGRFFLAEGIMLHALRYGPVHFESAVSRFVEKLRNHILFRNDSQAVFQNIRML